MSLDDGHVPPRSKALETKAAAPSVVPPSSFAPFPTRALPQGPNQFDFSKHAASLTGITPNPGSNATPYSAATAKAYCHASSQGSGGGGVEKGRPSVYRGTGVEGQSLLPLGSNGSNLRSPPLMMTTTPSPESIMAAQRCVGGEGGGKKRPREWEQRGGRQGEMGRQSNSPPLLQQPQRAAANANTGLITPRPSFDNDHAMLPPQAPYSCQITSRRLSGPLRHLSLPNTPTNSSFSGGSPPPCPSQDNDDIQQQQQREGGQQQAHLLNSADRDFINGPEFAMIFASGGGNDDASTAANTSPIEMQSFHQQEGMMMSIGPPLSVATSGVKDGSMMMMTSPPEEVVKEIEITAHDRPKGHPEVIITPPPQRGQQQGTSGAALVVEGRQQQGGGDRALGMEESLVLAGAATPGVIPYRPGRHQWFSQPSPPPNASASQQSPYLPIPIPTPARPIQRPYHQMSVPIIRSIPPPASALLHQPAITPTTTVHPSLTDEPLMMKNQVPPGPGNGIATSIHPPPSRRANENDDEIAAALADYEASMTMEDQAPLGPGNGVATFIYPPPPPSRPTENHDEIAAALADYEASMIIKNQAPIGLGNGVATSIYAPHSPSRRPNDGDYDEIAAALADYEASMMMEEDEEELRKEEEQHYHHHQQQVPEAVAAKSEARGQYPQQQHQYQQGGGGPPQQQNHQGRGGRGRGDAGGGRNAGEGLGIWRGRRGIRGVGGVDQPGRGGRGRGGRGRGGGMKMVYLSLQGHTLTGKSAIEQSRIDKANVKAGTTFTARRGEIRAACLQAEETAFSQLGAGGGGYLPSQDEKALLSYPGWGIPEVIVQSYEEQGVRKLFPWQVECLKAGNGRVLRQGGNLVYSAPTSGGKTMVAELLMLRALTHAADFGTALFVVPFIALAEEKARHFRKIWAGLELGVKSFHSDVLDATLSENVHIAVCTIERANALVNRLLERGELRRLKVVVVDELHMIADDHRGYLIEVMLSKLRMASPLAASSSPSAAAASASTTLEAGNSGSKIQIIGLSATLPNLPQVANWLGADLFITDYRPVQLSMMVSYGLRLDRLAEDGQTWIHERDLRPAKGGQSEETNALIQLCLEVVAQGQGVLVFCSSRAWTENCSNRLSEAIRRLASPVVSRLHLEMERKELLEKLRHTPVGLAPELEHSVPQGVAFHHAGLTLEERTLLEDAFKRGLISILVATSTLAAGVNLPARRVIIRDRKAWNHQEMSSAQFLQMCGRAGRFGIDAYGEAILMSRMNEIKATRAFVCRTLPPMNSALDRGQGGGIERAVLEVITGRLACGESWLEIFARSTLFYIQQPSAEKGLARFQEALSYLVKERFVSGRSVAGPAVHPQQQEAWEGDPALRLTHLRGTQLGSATFFASMAPFDATEILASLSSAASGGLNLTSDLYLLFLCVPPNRQFFKPSWGNLSRRSSRWRPEVGAVAEAIGIRESLLAGLQDQAPKDPKDEAILRRFVYALALHDMLQEVPLVQLQDDNVSRGTLQQLRQEAKMFCGMVVTFCRQLKWDVLARLIATLIERLEHGVVEELLPLFRIGPDLVHAHRARALFNAGYKTHEDLAMARVQDITKVLVDSMPFDPDIKGIGGQGSSRCVRLAERICRSIIHKSRALVRRDLSSSSSSSSASVVAEAAVYEDASGSGMMVPAAQGTGGAWRGGGGAAAAAGGGGRW